MTRAHEFAQTVLSAGLPPGAEWKEALAELERLAADAERLRDALETVRAWIRDGEGTESDAAEAMDAALHKAAE